MQLCKQLYYAIIIMLHYKRAAVHMLSQSNPVAGESGDSSKILWLSSNCNRELYGTTNRANHFFVYMNEEIVLPELERWGAALKEITYPSSIATIAEEAILLSIKPMLVTKLDYSKGSIITTLSDYFSYDSTTSLHKFSYTIPDITRFNVASLGRDTFEYTSVCS